MRSLKLFSRSLLAVSLLFSSYAPALTAEEVAKMAASSEIAAALAVQEKNASIMKLVDEISRLQNEVYTKTKDMEGDQRIRNVSIGISTLGVFAIGMSFIKGPDPSMYNRIQRLINYRIVTIAGATAAAGNAAVHQHFITVSREEIADLQRDLSLAKRNLLISINNTN